MLYPCRRSRGGSPTALKGSYGDRYLSILRTSPFVLSRGSVAPVRYGRSELGLFEPLRSGVVSFRSSLDPCWLIKCSINLRGLILELKGPSPDLRGSEGSSSDGPYPMDAMGSPSHGRGGTERSEGWRGSGRYKIPSWPLGYTALAAGGRQQQQQQSRELWRTHVGSEDPYLT